MVHRRPPRPRGRDARPARPAAARPGSAIGRPTRSTLLAAGLPGADQQHAVTSCAVRARRCGRCSPRPATARRPWSTPPPVPPWPTAARSWRWRRPPRRWPNCPRPVWRRRRSPGSVSTSPTARSPAGLGRGARRGVPDLDPRRAHDPRRGGCLSGWAAVGAGRSPPGAVGESGRDRRRTRARVAAGAIPAATLTVNRRQVDPVDRHALALLRGGDPAGSQQLRAGHGWEHEAATPAATRAAMADAVAADILDHGADVTVALVVSHGQAEDLADRIRRRLAAVGVCQRPDMTGPGWTTDRHYQAGDRVLFHTRYGDRHSPLVNGTVATVTAVDDHGLAIHTDGGTAASIPLEFVRGVRPDGTPNLSHAWARTVDGAQGGTWDHAHLLGSAALDAYRGYTGQSRSRHPTHTWNTTPVDDGDHGGRLADRRTAQNRWRRRSPGSRTRPWPPSTTPGPLDRQLRAVIDAHHAVLDRQPPDRTRELADARRASPPLTLSSTPQNTRRGGNRRQLDNLGPLAGPEPGRSGRAPPARDRLPAEQQPSSTPPASWHGPNIASSGSKREQAATTDSSGPKDGDATPSPPARPARRPLDGRRLGLLSRRRPPRFRRRAAPPRPPAPHRPARPPRRLPPRRPPRTARRPRPTGRRRRRTASRRAGTGRRQPAARPPLTTTMATTRLPRHRWRRRPHRPGPPPARPGQRTEAESGARLDLLDAHQTGTSSGAQRHRTRASPLIVDLDHRHDLERTRPERVLEALDQPASWQVELLGPAPDLGGSGRVVRRRPPARNPPRLPRPPNQVGASATTSPTHRELCALADRYLHVDQHVTRPREWAQAADASEQVREQVTRHQRELERPELRS